MPQPTAIRGQWKVVAFLLLAVAIVLAWVQGGGWSADDLLRERDRWLAWYGDNGVLTVLGFSAVYVLVAALSIPGAVVLTLVAGATFGLGLGIVVVAVSSVAGATLAMLLARHLLRGWVERRYAATMLRFQRGIARDGALYLFGLRLIPAVPFFLVNLVMGLTRMPPGTFAWVSALGMLPATIVYVNAGEQIGTVASPGDILGWRVILALLALAALPFAARWGVGLQRRKAALRRWQRPATLEFNLVVIGAGSAGLVTAAIAAGAGARVALVEEGEMGGDCLNTGCVPSKALLRAAALARDAGRADTFGLTSAAQVRFPDVMDRLRQVIARIAPHDSVERFEAMGVRVFRGRARVTDPWTVAVDGRPITAARIVIATGAAPVIPGVPGIEDVAPLTSETIWRLDRLPGHLMILGGGAIGCELAQAFARLGSGVTVVERAARVLPAEDPEASALVARSLMNDGVRILTGRAVERFEGAPGAGCALVTGGERIAFDALLVAVGRRPRVEGFGLEELGLIEDGGLVLDDRLSTRIPTIHAAGDVVGGLQFTHAAAAYAWSATMNALFGWVRTWSPGLEVFPSVVYTDPEVARTGLSELDATARGIPFEVTRVDFASIDRAVIEGATDGFAKVLTVPGKDRILGVTLCGAHAGDMLPEFTLAMRNGLGLRAILRTVHPYPGWADANRALATAWQKAHTPTWVLSLSARLLRRQRGG